LQNLFLSIALIWLSKLDGFKTLDKCFTFSKAFPCEVQPHLYQKIGKWVPNDPQIYETLHFESPWAISEFIGATWSANGRPFFRKCDHFRSPWDLKGDPKFVFFAIFPQRCGPSASPHRRAVLSIDFGRLRGTLDRQNQRFRCRGALISEKGADCEKEGRRTPFGAHSGTMRHHFWIAFEICSCVFCIVIFAILRKRKTTPPACARRPE
jgi:hypothetical protein